VPSTPSRTRRRINSGRYLGRTSVRAQRHRPLQVGNDEYDEYDLSSLPPPSKYPCPDGLLRLWPSISPALLDAPLDQCSLRER
jgi:hypothetical protein